MRILRWLLGIVVAVIVVVGTLDTFGGYFLDGPIGPIPGGRLSGPVSTDPNPDWSNLEKVIELEIRPARPWSLNVWNVFVDGELYVPSAKGAWRRWTAVVLEEPLIRLRTHGQIYLGRIEQVTDPELRLRVGRAIAERYAQRVPESADTDTTWYFHITPRT